MAGITRAQPVDQRADRGYSVRHGKALLRGADPFAQPREIQDAQRDGVRHLGVGIVRTLPSGEITVLVPLPFGTMMSWPP